MAKLLGRIIFAIFGWKLVSAPPEGTDKCVMIASPHTSNWDLVFARAAFAIMGIPVKFTIKKEWMRFPLNLFFGPLGGISIDRSPKEGSKERKSMTEAMIDLFNKHEKLVIMVTPEGTRKKATKWKTGFYYVAKGAGVPIGLGFLDYANRAAGVGKMIYPGEDMRKDMKEIMDFYRPIKGKHPDQFSTDEEFD